MPHTKLPLIKIGFQVFTEDGGEVFGAVRAVAPNGEPVIVVYVENAGEFTVDLDAVRGVHAQKVIVALDKLDKALRLAIGHAHMAETQ